MTHPIRRSGAMAAFAAILVLVAGFSAAEAQAQVFGKDRDSALLAVQSLARDLLASVESKPEDTDRHWAGIQSLGEAVNRLALRETEIRSEMPVGPPTDAARRPGALDRTGLRTWEPQPARSRRFS